MDDAAGLLTRRSTLRALATVYGAGVLAACSTQPQHEKSTEGGGSLVTKLTTIEVAHTFTPENPDADGRYMPVLVQRVQQISPNLKIQENTDGISPQKVITLAAAGTPPDVSMAYVLQGATYAAQKLAVPLEPLLKTAKDWSAADFVEGAKEAYLYNKELLFAPFLVAPMAITLNLDMLEHASLKLPSSTWTWDDFTDYAVKLTRRSGDQVQVYGAALPYTPNTNITEYFGSMLWSHGGDWINRQTGAITFHRAEGIAALETWVNLTLRQRVAPATEPDAWKPFQPRPATRGGVAMANGLAAMSYAYSPGVLEYQKVMPPTIRWTTTQMPRRKGPGAHHYACAWFVLAGAKNRDGAAEFIRIATQPEMLVQWNIACFGMVTRKSATTLPEWQAHLKQQPLLVPYAETLNYTRTYPAVAGWADVMQGEGGVGPAVFNAAQGKVAPQAALEESARVAEGILAQLNK